MTDIKQSGYLIAICTVPDQATASLLADKLVSAGLAACVNIVPGIQSVYAWQGKIEQDNELLLMIKTKSSVFSELEQLILQHHPYELPEIIAVSIEAGSTAYLDWINNAVGTKHAS
ncbi:MAG: divalent-cation tolerance protein CutA [Gammaproteobacteria bacterium]|nr:divalent-cation tolerance protein CutA [Gammaproteobacteria bacterium]MDH5778759.1 divalent-cation tolerance protein CutA [Gammaproteobacteria bacterium]